MQDLIESPEDEGIEYMFDFTQKTRRQRINQRNRVERLSPLLDWKNLGIEYSKARQLALRRAYPDAFAHLEGEEYVDGEGEEDQQYQGGMTGVERYFFSRPASPRLRPTGLATPGDMGTLTEEMQRLGTGDYRGWAGVQEDEDSYPFPLVMKVRSRAGSIKSGASTPGGGVTSLSEGDLMRADEKLSYVAVNGA